jgi:DNA-directed RNA polymerase subunit RPC12/RpoP
MGKCSRCGARGRYYKSGPRNYIEWMEWAEKMQITHDQLRCPQCRYYTVWVKKRTKEEK